MKASASVTRLFGSFSVAMTLKASYSSRLFHCGCLGVAACGWPAAYAAARDRRPGTGIPDPLTPGRATTISGAKLPANVKRMLIFFITERPHYVGYYQTIANLLDRLPSLPRVPP